MLTDALVERFATLYSGYSRAYGQYEIKKVTERGKAAGRALTVAKPPTPDLYRQHLTGGAAGLGIVMLRDDDTCLFGAIDVDDPKTDHGKVEAAVEALELPLIIIRSKSGGVHLTCFCTEPVPALLLQRKLSEWCALLGYSAKTEIFPKQTSRAGPDDVGNWINLPYYEAAATTRYAIRGGKALTLPDFLDFAEHRRVSEEFLDQLTCGTGEPEDLFYEGPPCLQLLHQRGGLAVGTMRDGMFDVGVYLRKRFPDNWADRLAVYNLAMCSPPLRNDEIQELIKSLKKKDYGYKCKQPPIHEHCQRKLCLSRRFGIGDAGPQTMGLEISGVICYKVDGTDDPPTWSMEIGGRRILIDNRTFYERDSFNRAALAAIGRVPVHAPPSRWLRIVDELAANADVIYTPQEASTTGNLWEWITSYLMGAKCAAMEQIADQGAYIEEGFVYFRVLDLFAFLDRRHIAYSSKQFLYHLLKQHGGETHFRNFKKAGYNVWKVPLPQAAEVEESAVPSFKQTTPF